MLSTVARQCSQNCESTVAGKLFNQGGSAKECLQPNLSQTSCSNQTSDAPQKSQSFVHKITHGVSSQSSLPASQLINPDPKTHFQQRFLNKKEQHYVSKSSPLGKSRLQKPSRNGVVPDNSQLYGIPTELDVEAGEIVNPRKSRKQVDEETKAGHDQYVVTHHDYDVGQTYDRKYDWSSTNPKTTRFGIETPHYNDGRNMVETLTWMHKKPAERSTIIVSKRVDEFRERTQPQLGKVHDPIADTLKVRSDHTYGIMVRPDKYGVGDLLHMRSPRNYLLGKDRERGVLATVRQQLKKANYHNFSDLHSAFNHYDYDNAGYLDAQKIRDACWKFNLPIDNDLLSSLMHYCAVENDDNCKLDYVKFVNFLNWKDKVVAPSVHANLPEQGSAKSTDADNDVRQLCKQIDKAMTNHMTSSSAIDAVVGGVQTKDQPAYGVPTVRSDLPAPRTRRISDHTNYGDESDAYGLVNPSIYTRRGVFERDFFEPRPRDDIRTIFEQIGVKMTEEAFDKIWKLAVDWTGSPAEDNDNDRASVEAFRTILDKIHAVSIQEANGGADN